MTSHTEPTPEAISTRLFIYVVLGTVAFLGAMGLVFTFMK